MANISQEEAKDLILQWRADGLNITQMRRQLVDRGFSFSEAYELLDEEEYKGKTSVRQRNKIKNDYSYQYRETFERGGCLTAYLIFNIIGGVLGTCGVIALAGSPEFAGLGALIVVAVVVGVAQVAAAFALLEGKQWGYNVLMMMQGLSILLGLFAANIISIIGSVGAMIILYTLVSPKEHLLE